MLNLLLNMQQLYCIVVVSSSRFAYKIYTKTQKGKLFIRSLALWDIWHSAEIFACSQSQEKEENGTVIHHTPTVAIN